MTAAGVPVMLAIFALRYADDGELEMNPLESLWGTVLLGIALTFALDLVVRALS
jgi:hypothetical protein